MANATPASRVTEASRKPTEGYRSLRKGTETYPAGSILDQLGGQMDCFITYTTDQTAELIRANLHKSPMYSGVIEGVGPRYCPSIEDKIVKFPEKERQQIFLEPEGIATDEIYVNGFSTCLPYATKSCCDAEPAASEFCRSDQ